MPASQSAVHSAVSAVLDPVVQQSLGALRLIREVTVQGDAARIVMDLLSPASAARARIEADVRAAAAQAGARQVELVVGSAVRTRQVAGDDPCPEVKNLIPVMSGKGGVGKSTVAVNLALSLLRSGARTALLDADIYGPSIPTMLGITGHPVSQDGEHIDPLERFGLPVMSIGFLLEDPKTAVVWRGPMIQGALQQFLKDVAWGKLDYLVLDLPPGTGDVALTLFQKARVTGAVIVTTPQEVALQDVFKSVNMCQKLDVPVLGVVENMSWFQDPTGARHEIFGKGGGAQVAEYAQAPVLGQIPLDMALREAGDAGTPVVEAQPDSASAQVFRQIAGRLADRVTEVLFAQHGGKAPAEGPKRLPILR